ncbi:MAG: hypothetical protein KF865_03695 [Bdellovibrionaceae bacterium]|nr:hypothetical protein [Pseudobdellovibrionaceae bacterium]
MQQLASQCQAQVSSATGSCEASQDSQLSAVEREGQQVSSGLSQQANTQAACQQAQNYQNKYSQALGQFASRCENAVSACRSSCEQAAQAASSCNSSEVQSARAGIQSGINACSSGGTLTTKAQQVVSQKQSASNNLSSGAAGANCMQAASASSETPTDSSDGPLKQNMNTATLDNPGLGYGQGSGGGLPQAVNAAGNGDTPRTATFSDDSDVSGAVDQSGGRDGGGYGDPGNTGGVYSGNPNSQLASLPSSPAAKSLSEAEIQERKTASVYSGSGRGSSGRRGIPLTRGSLRSSTGDDFLDDELTTAQTAEEMPDLNQFRPTGLRMAGLKQDGGATLGKSDENFFQVIKARYYSEQPILFQPSENP